MSEVYRASDIRLHRDVAVKILPSFLSSDPDRLRRFEQEARAAASLNHPHIVTIHSIEKARGVHFLTMELIEGKTLDRMIPEGGLPLENFFDFAVALVDAVAAAHEKGIIHRDLKPTNVMVDRRGIVKILDFGLARITELAAPQATGVPPPASSQSEAGMVMGTIPYMSPEQLQGKKLDQRSDIFSVGVVLYQMATGKRPFSAETSAELMSSILRDTPTPAMELRSDLPISLQRIVERCMAKDVSQRFASARELFGALSQQRQEFRFGLNTDWASSAPDASVAVLPFLNLSADPENEFFSDGMTEEIINALTQIKKLHVAARTSSFSFKGKHVDLRVVGERLNVRTVLEGSVRRAANQVRITAQLVNVVDGYHLWSESYDREMKDIFQIQEEIARSIAERLKVTLDEDRPLVRAGTDNLEAYQLYVKGRTLFFQRGQRLRRSLECFQRAVVVDPNYALAWAGLADAYNMIGFYGLAEPEACLPQARDAAQRSVTLDSSLAETHCALAHVYLYSHTDQSQAGSEFLRAMELNPRYLQARIWYGLFYLQWAEGRLEEGLQQTKLAAQSDPLSGYAHAMLAAAYVTAGKLEEAVQAVQAALRLDPEFFTARWLLHTIRHQLGEFEEAVAGGELTLAISGRHPWMMAELALTYCDWGRLADAEALYMELRWRAKREYVQLAVLAWAASAVNDREAAIRYAQEAHQRRDPIMISAKHMPEFARLRKDPQFDEIISVMGLK